MEHRYTIMQSLPESVVRPTRDLAVQLAKEYMAEHNVDTIYVVQVVSTVSYDKKHQVEHHSRRG
jgi:hypothetical protein